MDNRIDLFENSLSPEVCKDIIRRFDVDERKFEGGVSYGDGRHGLEPGLKKCTELYLSAHDDWKDIDDILFGEVRSKILFLRKKYTGLQRIHKVMDEGYRVKHYKNDGSEFFNWHIDSNGRNQGHRYYVIQWYLNTVEEGGETEFRLPGEDGRRFDHGRDRAAGSGDGEPHPRSAQQPRWPPGCLGGGGGAVPGAEYPDRLDERPAAESEPGAAGQRWGDGHEAAAGRPHQ